MRVAKAVRHEPGDELAHPISQSLFIRLQVQALHAQNIILVCDNDSDTAVTLYATLLHLADPSAATLTVVCGEGSATQLKKLLLQLAQPSQPSSRLQTRLRVVEDNPATFLKRLTPASYDMLLVSGQAHNYVASYAAAPSPLRPNGLLILTDACASADNPHGGVTEKVDQSTKTVTLRSILLSLQKSDDFDSVLLPIGTGLLYGLRR